MPEEPSPLGGSEARFRAMADASPVGIFLSDPSGANVYTNPALLRMVGLTFEEALGGAWQAAIHPEDRDHAIAVYGESAALRENVDVVHRYIRRDGTTVWVHVKAAPVADAGTHLGYVGVVEDISDRLRTEAELRESQTFSALGALLAGVAHEVRNPLFSLSATLDAFEARLGAEGEHAPFLAALRQQVTRLSDLMGDLLEYGKPNPPELSSGTLEAVVAEAVLACEELARVDGVAMRVELPPGLPALQMDARRMVHVFRNLLDNAIRHSPRGGEVRLTATARNEAGRSVIDCAVHDGGTGFEGGDLGRVFEPFFTKRQGGTGLGLSIVRRIVLEHGGSVVAVNRSGGGAEVRIRLPVG
jgi:PAS domain S-box-containing protein